MLSTNGSAPLPAGQETCAHGWVAVSWDELAQLCLRLAAQLRGADRPDVVVALARAGYVPGAILASLLRCELLTVQVPPGGPCGRPPMDESGIASLRQRLAGRRVLILDETTRTGESLAWAARAAAEAGAATVHTAALFLEPGNPPPDYYAATVDAHILQPWVPWCIRGRSYA